MSPTRKYLKLKNECHLFDIPTDFLVNLLTSWLTMRDVARLDEALCARHCTYWLELLASPGTNFPLRTFSREGCLSWIMHRKISVQNLYCRGDISPETIKQFILYSRKSLNSIVLWSVRKDSNAVASVIASVVASISESLGTGCPMLKSLNIYGFDIPTPITDEQLGVLTNGCPSLENLSVWNAPSLSNSSIPLLIQNCPVLNSVSIQQWPNASNGGNGGIDSTGILLLAAGCKSLRSLELITLSDSMDDSVMGEVARSNPMLEKLNVSGKNITDLGIHRLSTSCRFLKCLKLSRYNITDTSLAALSTNTPLLEDLDISFCRRITDAGLASLSLGCSSLRCLGLSFCSQVTDVGIACLAARCRLLEGLDIHRCDGITDAAMTSLSMGCPLLKTITPHDTLTDAGLASLATGCARLRTLTLHACEELTDDGIIVLAEGCRTLESVFLPKTDKITAKSRDLLTKRRCLC